MDANLYEDHLGKILLKTQKLTVIKTYAPTDDAMDEEKDEFYNQLRDSVARCSGHDLCGTNGLVVNGTVSHIKRSIS